MMRRLIVHAGTHKTGTTAIQHALMDQAQALARSGVLVPLAGRGDAIGHHEIVEAMLFGPKRALAGHTLTDLVAELQESEHSLAVVSSENFSTLFAFPHLLDEMAGALRAIGYATTVVLYVREQAAFAESLYAELLKHGLTWSFEKYIAHVLERGVVDATNERKFAFDYALLAGRFETAFGHGSVVVRPFLGGAPPAALLDDLWSVLGVDRERAPSLDAKRANERSSALDSLDALHRSLVTSQPELPDVQIIARDASPIDLRELGLPLTLLDGRGVREIRDRFEASNRDLFRKYGTEVPIELARSSEGMQAQRRLYRLVSQRWQLR